eukprot:7276166-Ditylum_brightwellii.AAC.1
MEKEYQQIKGSINALHTNFTNMGNIFKQEYTKLSKSMWEGLQIHHGELATKIDSAEVNITDFIEQCIKCELNKITTHFPIPSLSSSAGATSHPGVFGGIPTPTATTGRVSYTTPAATPGLVPSTSSS